NREMELDELRRLQREVKGAAAEIEQSMRSAATDFQSGIKGVEQQLNEGATETAPAPPSVPEVPDTTSAAGPSQGASSSPSGGSAAAELANEAASVGAHLPEEAP